MMLSKVQYRPDVDGLRAIAVLSVMIYHLNSAFLPGGFVGVDVFFVISGFVVTSSLVAGRSASLPAFVGEFYARRLARIVPALVLALVVSAFAATLFIPEAWLSSLSERTAQYAFFGLSNWVMQANSDFYFAPRAEFNPYVQTWSLGVEEQFYLITPFLIYLWIRSLRREGESRSHATLVGLVFLCVASLLACAWSSQSDPMMAFYFIGCRLWELGLGVLLFLSTFRVQSNAEESGAVWRNSTAWIGLICICVSFFYADEKSFPWPWALLPVAGTLLLIGSATTRPTDMVRRTLAASAAVWIGKRSYALYLWHWPVYVLMRWTVGLEGIGSMAVAVSTTCALAFISYRWVEQPLRHNARIEAWPRFARIAGFILLPICGFLIATHFFDHRQFYSLNSVTRNPLDWYASAQMPYPDLEGRQCRVRIEWLSHESSFEKRYQPTECREEVDARTIYVFGDSHAGALSPALDQISAAEGIVIRSFTHPGCGYLELRQPAAKKSADCLEFVRSVTAEATETSKPGDIVVLASLRLMRYGDQWASFGVTDMFSVMYAPHRLELRREATEAARLWLQQLSDAELEVVFVAPTPVFKAPAFRCADWFNRTNPICVGDNQQPRSELEALRAPILESMSAFSQTFRNVRVWDPFPTLCPDEVCHTHLGGRPLFFDGDHLSGYGNLVLYPKLSEFLLGRPPF
jgi:peptidoglycan/LPS O-acetylase OafA/YrhL